MASLSIKVVPGAKRSRIVGRYGQSIKVQVSAPPEAGKANEAVVALLAAALGISPRDISISRGHSQPRKKIEVAGIDQATAERRLLSAAG